MRRTLVVIPVLLLAAAGAAQAQQVASAEPTRRVLSAPLTRQQDDARLHVNRLLEGVTLTAEQRLRVDSLVERWTVSNALPNAEPVEDEPQDTTQRQPSPNNPNPAAPVTQDYRQLEAQVRSVLTPEQQRVWDANVERARPLQRRR